MTVTINGTTGVTTPEVTVDNSNADGGQVVLKSTGYSNWNIDNYNGSLRNYYGSTVVTSIDSSGNVGIGTNSPNQKLQINTSAGTGGQIQITNAATGAGTSDGVLIGFDSSNDVIINNQEATQTKLYANGSIGINIDSTRCVQFATTTRLSDMRFTIYGATNIWGCGPSASADNFYVFNGGGAGVYLAWGSSSWSSISDERKKTIVSEITNATNKVNQLRAVNYTWKSDKDNTQQVGLIAQDVQKVLPEVVTEDNGYLGVKYAEMVPLLVAAIKELSAKNDALEARITALEAK